MAIEKYNSLFFEIIREGSPNDGYYYVIYYSDYEPEDDVIMYISKEYFDTYTEARFAAIGHIGLIEDMEPIC